MILPPRGEAGPGAGVAWMSLMGGGGGGAKSPRVEAMGRVSRGRCVAVVWPLRGRYLFARGTRGPDGTPSSSVGDDAPKTPPDPTRFSEVGVPLQSIRE